MPRISEFFGIVIFMYWFDNKRHQAPHIHAIYNGNEAVFDFQGHCIAGNIGRRATSLVKEFIRERRLDLEDAWEKAIKGKDLPWIKPIS